MISSNSMHIATKLAEPPPAKSEGRRPPKLGSRVVSASVTTPKGAPSFERKAQPSTCS